MLRLSCFNLSQKSECFVAIFVFLTSKDRVKVLFCGLEISIMELNLCETEEGLVVLRVVFETLFVVLECLIEVAGDVANFTL